MNGSEIVTLLFAIRIVIPVGLLLLVGEFVRRNESNYWLKVR
jgi:hypothetical protein